jgi:hypothetical protein
MEADGGSGHRKNRGWESAMGHLRVVAGHGQGRRWVCATSVERVNFRAQRSGGRLVWSFLRDAESESKEAQRILPVLVRARGNRNPGAMSMKTSASKLDPDIAGQV